MKICFFGIYNKNYARNKVLMSGLSAHGIEIVECNVDPRIHKGFKKYWILYKAVQKLHKKEFDVVVVGFPGHTVVWLAKLLFRKKKIIFDAFLSLFDSNVYDRKLHTAHSLRGRYDWFMDWYSSKLADIVLVDTNQHIDFFHTTFGLAKEKMIRIFIGADIEMFYPQSVEKNDAFIVHFHGSFIPLQGLDYIIKAALLLEKHGVIIQIVGDGQEGKKVRQQIAESGKGHNIRMIGSVSVSDVPTYIAAADVCLGIFGDTPKTQRVIPNKVYECLAMAKPVITARTPAILEIAKDGETIVLTNIADPEDIVDKILQLKQDPERAKVIAEKGYQYFKQYLFPHEIVDPLIHYINN